MESPIAIWGEVAQRWTDLQAHVLENQWTNKTPCPGWDVAELVKHANDWQARGGAVLGAQITPDADWSLTHEAVSAAIADPSNLEGVASEFNNMPKHQILGMLIGDLTTHCWDLARSIDEDDTLPPAAVEATLMGLKRYPPEVMRREGMFGPEVAIADDAPLQDQLIAFTGRDPYAQIS